MAAALGVFVLLEERKRVSWFALGALGPAVLLGTTSTPYIDAANALLALGFDPERRLLMRRRGVDVNQLSYELEEAAALGAENQQIIPATTLYPVGQDGPGAVP